MSEDLELEGFIKELASLMNDIDAAPAIINPAETEKMDIVADAARYLAKKYGMKVIEERNKPLKTMGSITLEGRQIFTSEPKILSRMMRMASNTELYVLTTGNVRLTFTFHGIARSLR